MPSRLPCDLVPPGPARRTPTWLSLLRQRAFALLWVGEFVSFLGDQIFFIALSLWIYNLTGSATLLATTLVATTIGQGLFGFLAGAVVDRVDRRSVIVAADIGRALIVAALPSAMVRSIPGALALLLVLNIGTMFFRSSIFALMPSVVKRDDLPTATALFHSTERIAEVIGGVVGGTIVLTLGYHIIFYLDALSFLISAALVGLMPVAWGAGLTTVTREQITVEIGRGLRFIWGTPLHRILALLILPGYLTLAFDALQAPMIIKTAGLSAVAFGVINSVLGIGKLVASIILAGGGKQWLSPKFVVITFLWTALAAALFGVSKAYVVLIAAAFMFGFGNIATTITNTALSIAYTPPGLLGRLLSSRLVFIAGIKVIALLVFGRLADAAGPPIALATLGIISGIGVAIVWSFGGGQLPKQIETRLTG